jgi:hypothetical protein
MKLQCSITKLKYLRGEVQCPQIETEMERLNGDTKMQQGMDDMFLKNLTPKCSQCKE